MERLKYGLRYVVAGVLGLFALAVLAGLSGAWYVNHYVDLRGWIESQLAVSSSDLGIEIGDAKVGLAFSLYPIEVITKDVRVMVPEQSLDLPQANFGFSLLDLLKGDLLTGAAVPRSVVLTGVAFGVEHRAGGWHAGASFGTLVGALTQNQAGGEAGGDGAPFIFPLDRLVIVAGKMTMFYPSFEADEDNRSLVIDGIELRLVKSANEDIAIALSVEQSALGHITLSGRFGVDGLDVVADLDDFDSGQFYPYLGMNLPELHDLGRVSGAVRLTLAEGRLTQLYADITASDGQILVPSIGAMGYDSASSRLRYVPSEDRLVLDEFTMIASASAPFPGRYSLQGEISDASTPTPFIKVVFDGEAVPLEPMLQFLPKRVEWTNIPHEAMLKNGIVHQIELDMSARIDRVAGKLVLDAMSLQASFGQVDFAASMEPVESLEGQLDGEIDLIIESDGVVRTLETRFYLTEARLKPFYSDDFIALKGVEVVAELEGKTLVIRRGGLDAYQQGQVAMQGRVNFDDDFRPMFVETQIFAEQIDAQAVRNLWPKTLFSTTRKWVRTHISDGVINGFRLNLGLDVGGGALSLLFVEGGGQLKAPSFTYLNDTSPIENADVSLKFSGTKLGGVDFDLQFNKGMVRTIDLKGSALAIFYQEGKSDMALSLLGRGDFGQVMQVLDEPKFNLLARRGLSPTGVAGAVDIAGAIKWQLDKGGDALSLADLDIRISATADAVVMPNLPANLRLDEARFGLQYSNGMTRINGQGLVSKAPARFDIELANGGGVYALSFAKGAGFTEFLNDQFPFGLAGASGGRITLTEVAEADASTLKAELDLEDAHFHIPHLELIKLEGESAKVKAHLRLKNGRLQEISDVEMESDAIAFKGRLAVDDAQNLTRAHFAFLEWPGNALRAVDVARASDGRLSITADADVLDLRPLRRQQRASEGFQIDITLSAERLILDRRLSLAGQAKLSAEEDGRGKAQFLGNLYLLNEEFITEANLTAHFGGEEDLLEGHGLIGGSEAFLTLRSGAETDDHLRLTTSNAGQVLKALAVTDAIRGGDMTMDVFYDSENDGYYTANFMLKDFRVIEAPTAVRMLSVLSFAGLYSLLQGDGTAFTDGSARIRISPDEQRIDFAKARGDALAVEITGIINRHDDTLDVSGVLFPVYQIVQIIGRVPIIGEILTGINREGIFNTLFRMKGAVDDPKLNVRLASIAPGLLRDIFAPEWIDSERLRLFGDEDAPTSAAPAS